MITNVFLEAAINTSTAEWRAVAAAAISAIYKDGRSATYAIRGKALL
jgi:hypothetical protein